MPASAVLAEFILGGDTNYSSGPFVGRAFKPRRFTSTRDFPRSKIPRSSMFCQLYPKAVAPNGWKAEGQVPYSLKVESGLKRTSKERADNGCNQCQEPR